MCGHGNVLFFSILKRIKKYQLHTSVFFKCEEFLWIYARWKVVVIISFQQRKLIVYVFESNEFSSENERDRLRLISDVNAHSNCHESSYSHLFLLDWNNKKHRR